MKRSRRRTAPEAGPEILAGPHAVLEALRAERRRVRRLLLARQERGEALGALLDLARARSLPVEERPRADLDLLAPGVTHQGVLAEADAFPYLDPDGMVRRAAAAAGGGFLAVLDGIQDPQNLGAIIRTLEAAGVHGLVLPRDRAAGVSPAVVRASAGAAEHLAVARVTNLASFLEGIKEAGFWVVGADAAGEQSLFAADLTGPLALVIGGEERGLRQLTKARCDRLLRIPLGGRVSSLNAAAAAAVCVFEALRQRSGKKPGSG